MNVDELSVKGAYMAVTGPLNGGPFAVLIFHHSGEFVRHHNGKLEYVNGTVNRLDDYELLVDELNFQDLVTVCEGLGYKSFKDLFWWDITAPELETGLNKLVRNEGIVELIEWLNNNVEKEFHIFVEHVVNNPILAEGAEYVETIHLDDNSSSSGDGYEFAEDEAYKPPPCAYEEDGSGDSLVHVHQGSSKGKCVGCKKTEPARKVHQTKGKGVSDENKGKRNKKNPSKSCNAANGPSSVGPGSDDEMCPTWMLKLVVDMTHKMVDPM
ncbi:hypothetical protein PIB30_104301 [Stylosanthes scabra]|uniref:PB1-like domain-containing protein n=1 Tax=Stylosanthes scabra TaxID=79078 RepID=A0ABU6ZXI6_9FABA|nr:hypothetical protein [Stylosanthes scabra]